MTKFCAKGTEVSPMSRTSYDFEKYGVLKIRHFEGLSLKERRHKVGKIYIPVAKSTES